MPVLSLRISETNPKEGTFQYTSKRIAGLRLVIPSNAGVTKVTNNRIVSIQENNTTQEMVAVTGHEQQSGYTTIGYGVLESALQSGGNGSIAPEPNTLVNGDTVVVLRDPDAVYMIEIDPSSVPANGIGTAYVDRQGRITGSSSSSTQSITGSVFRATVGVQLSNQLKTNHVFYQMFNALTL